MYTYMCTHTYLPWDVGGRLIRTLGSFSTFGEREPLGRRVIGPKGSPSTYGWSMVVYTLYMYSRYCVYIYICMDIYIYIMDIYIYTWIN